MGKPMKNLCSFLSSFFTEKAYAEAGTDDRIEGVIISEESLKKMQRYLKEAQKMVLEASIDIENTNISYRNQIEDANAKIRAINQKIQEINDRRESDYSQQAIDMLKNAMNALKSNVTLEVGSPTRHKSQNGKYMGGKISTVSDPKLRKNRGGIITPVNDKSDYSGQYVRLQKIIQILEPVVDKIYEEQQKKKPTIPEVDELAIKMVNDARKIINFKRTNAVKVTQKTLLKKRVVPVMLALGIFASTAVGALRGTNVSISGAHGNNEYTTGVTEQIEKAQLASEVARDRLGIHYQENLEEEKTIHNFDGDPALIAEERKKEYHDEGEKIIERERKIQSSYGDISFLSNEDSAQYFIDQYNVLIEQYEHTMGIYKEDSGYVQGIIDANQQHINISNGTQAPNKNQKGLVDSLDEKDIKRHKSQNETEEETLNGNSKIMSETAQIIEEAQKRIDFINILRQQNGFKDIIKGNFENTFESLYQMYSKRADQISMEDFMEIIEENGYNLNIMAEYAKEEKSDITLEKSLARLGLINNSYEIYLEEYALDEAKVNISSYTQYANQYIEDNPEIGRDGGVFTIIQGQFSQNDMNSGFYTHRQEEAKKEGVIKSIFRNIKTSFNGQRRSKYVEAVKKQKQSIKEFINSKDNSR